MNFEAKLVDNKSDRTKRLENRSEKSFEKTFVSSNEVQMQNTLPIDNTVKNIMDPIAKASGATRDSLPSDRVDSLSSALGHMPRASNHSLNSTESELTLIAARSRNTEDNNEIHSTRSGDSTPDMEASELKSHNAENFEVNVAHLSEHLEKDFVVPAYDSFVTAQQFSKEITGMKQTSRDYMDTIEETFRSIREDSARFQKDILCLNHSLTQYQKDIDQKYVTLENVIRQTSLRLTTEIEDSNAQYASFQNEVKNDRGKIITMVNDVYKIRKKLDANDQGMKNLKDRVEKQELKSQGNDENLERENWRIYTDEYVRNCVSEIAEDVRTGCMNEIEKIRSSLTGDLLNGQKNDNANPKRVNFSQSPIEVQGPSMQFDGNLSETEGNLVGDEGIPLRYDPNEYPLPPARGVTTTHGNYGTTGADRLKARLSCPRFDYDLNFRNIMNHNRQTVDQGANWSQIPPVWKQANSTPTVAPGRVSDESTMYNNGVQYALSPDMTYSKQPIRTQLTQGPTHVLDPSQVQQARTVDPDVTSTRTEGERTLTKSKYPTVAVPKFTGEGDIDRFFTRYEQMYQKINGGDYATDFLDQCFDGAILDLFFTLKKEILEDKDVKNEKERYFKIKERMRKFYSNDLNNPDIARSKLSCIEQRLDEPLPDFAARIIDLTHKAFPESSNTKTVINREMSTHFLNGVRDSDTALEIRWRFSKSMDDFHLIFQEFKSFVDAKKCFEASKSNKVNIKQIGQNMSGNRQQSPKRRVDDRNNFRSRSPDKSGARERSNSLNRNFNADMNHKYYDNSQNDRNYDRNTDGTQRGRDRSPNRPTYYEYGNRSSSPYRPDARYRATSPYRDNYYDERRDYKPNMRSPSPTRAPYMQGQNNSGGSRGPYNDKGQYGDNYERYGNSRSRSKSPNRTQGWNRSRSPRYESPDQCYRCGKTGHFARNCPEVCYNCGGIGHYARECQSPWQQGRAGPQSPKRHENDVRNEWQTDNDTRNSGNGNAMSAENAQNDQTE